MTKSVRVNVTSLVDNAKIRAEVRNGRDVLVVPSATMPDNIVMNGIMYPADEIGRAFSTLERTVAPYGHPKVNGAYVSAADPEGLATSWIGAWNANVRRANGRVLLDKVIDRAVAASSANGKAVLNAIDKGEPVHTSTGVFVDLEDAPEGSGYKHVARNLRFDHDAILIGEVGAATPEQGVGMMVNGTEVEVVNSSIEWAERELDYSIGSVAEAMVRVQRASVLDSFKEKLLSLLKSTMSKEDEEMPDDPKIAAMAEEVKKLNESITALSANIDAAVKRQVDEAVAPIVNQMKAQADAAAASEQAERNEMIERALKLNVFTEEDLKEMPTGALRKIAGKAVAGKAAGITGNSDVKADDVGAYAADFDPNKLLAAKH